MPALQPHISAGSAACRTLLIMKRRLAAFAAAGVLAVQIAGAGPASADTFDLACNYDDISNACLNFQNVGEVDRLNAHVGLDWHMPQQDAQDIVDRGGDFQAQLFADDHGRRTLLADLSVMPGWPSAGPDGLGVEFLVTSLQRANFLDEDPGQPDQDELVARITFWNARESKLEVFTTGIVHGDFSPLTGGCTCCFITFC